MRILDCKRNCTLPTLMDYAKLDNGSLHRLRQVPHVSNPTPETLAAYALAHGYKPLENTPSPGQYHTPTYADTGEAISQVWSPIDLESAKERAMDDVQQRLNNALSQRVAIPCSLGFPIIYDRDALINVIGMRAAGYCAAYIDANDMTHTLDAAEVQEVCNALEAHRTALYATAQQTRAAVQQAGTTAEVEEILTNLSL